MIRSILFVCQHGVAKSVIARAYFQHAADQRGLKVTSAVAGTEPETTVWPEVVDLLRQDGIELAQHHPRRVTQGDLDGADRVIALGCELTGFDLQHARVERWDDIPLASQDLPGAQAAIRKHVARLVDEVNRLQDQGDN